MRDIVANGADWWLNKLNTAGILPANVATFARSVSAKQFGGPAFTPRPLTADNFTPAELDALYRVSHDSQGGVRRAVTVDSYTGMFPNGKKFDESQHGYDRGGVLDYTSPLRVISTTLGQFGVADGKVRDIYDFNRFPVKFKDNGDGTVTFGSHRMKPEEIPEFIRTNYNRRSDGFYGRMRVNALRFAHNDGDPDSSKIKVNIPLDEIRKRLGDRLGTYDINKAMDAKEFVRRLTHAGAATGVLGGAALGLAGGTLSLADRERRKRWIRSLLYPTLVGAGAVGAIGALGGRYAGNKLLRRFTKSGSAACPDPEDTRKRRRARWGSILSGFVAYGAPLAAAAAGIGVAASKGRSLYKRISGVADNADEVVPRIVDADTYYAS